MDEHVRGNRQQRELAAANIKDASRVVDVLTAELFKHRQDCRDKLCSPVEYTKLLNALQGEDLLRITLHVAIERLV